MVNTNISESEKIAANTRVEKIVIKFEPPCSIEMFEKKLGLQINNRTLNQLRDEEGYRGWKALRTIMPTMKKYDGWVDK